ncbi:hypothetical protein K440DRAFT_643573 [Wilcoxina mikolae CBS 423.85]|nr:hypothetical protein K440DRAFT_643573 [Wilcoxina mikolae CBS 423.85]
MDRKVTANTNEKEKGFNEPKLPGDELRVFASYRWPKQNALSSRPSPYLSTYATRICVDGRHDSHGIKACATTRLSRPITNSPVSGLMPANVFLSGNLVKGILDEPPHGQLPASVGGPEQTVGPGGTRSYTIFLDLGNYTMISGGTDALYTQELLRGARLMMLGLNMALEGYLGREARDKL